MYSDVVMVPVVIVTAEVIVENIHSQRSLYFICT